MNKRGFTLMELLVYMAIVGIVVLIAGQVFSDSTKMRIRTQSMIQANQTAEDLGNILKDDISQMGAKSAVDAANSSAENDAFLSRSEVYMPTVAGAAPDYSSFNYEKDKYGAGLDKLTFRRIKYKASGDIDRFEEISWYATSNGILHRSCKTIPPNDALSVTAAPDDCPEDEPFVVNVTEGVKSFVTTPLMLKKEQILPVKGGVVDDNYRFISRYGENGFAYVPRTPIAGGTGSTLKNFVSNYDFENDAVKTTDIVVNQVFLAEKLDNESDAVSGDADANSWKDACSAVDLTIGTEYEIAFSIPSSSTDLKTFCPERDHLSVGFRKKSNGEAIENFSDFLFYPPASTEVSSERTYRFTPSFNISEVCLTFTFAMFSPATSSGALAINSVKLSKFTVSNEETIEKNDVKEFLLTLSITKNGEEGNVSLNIPTPNNGSRH